MTVNFNQSVSVIGKIIVEISLKNGRNVQSQPSFLKTVLMNVCSRSRHAREGRVHSLAAGFSYPSYWLTRQDAREHVPYWPRGYAREHYLQRQFRADSNAYAEGSVTIYASFRFV